MICNLWLRFSKPAEVPESLSGTPCTIAFTLPMVFGTAHIRTQGIRLYGPLWRALESDSPDVGTVIIKGFSSRTYPVWRRIQSQANMETSELHLQ